MNKPAVVKILGKRVEIRWNHEFNDDDMMGEISPDEGVVRMSIGLNSDDERETLLHELMHGIDYQLCIEQPEPKHRARSLAIFEMFVNNPGLSRFIFGD